MDDTLKIPPQMSIYADKHNILRLLQNLLFSLLVNQPDDPITYLQQLLQRSQVEIPRILLLGPPAVGKHTLARKLSADLGAVHVTLDDLLTDQSETSTGALSEGQVQLLQQRLNSVDCWNQGWVLAGFPQTRLQALSLQQVGIIPEHVVMLDAPDDVLLDRSQGRLVDPQTGDIYHQTFVRPPDDSVSQRLVNMPSEHLLALHRHRCEVTGLISAYKHVLKAINGDQPPIDVYQQVLAFVQTRHCYRTPRILLLGPPGSGKSHQARLLAEKYNMVDVCCSELLRSVAAGYSALAEAIRPHLEEKRPVPDSLVMQVLEERLSRADCSCRGWILHGFPRDLPQAVTLQESQYQPNRVFLLELTDDVCLERITLRATDPVSGERFHTVTHPAPTAEVQNRLKTRTEDSTHTVTQALSVYRTHTAALQSVFPGLVHVDADQDPHCVFESLESRLTTF